VVAACPPRTRQSSAFGPSQIGAGATPGYCAFGAFESLSSRASSWSEPEGVHFPGDPYTPQGGMPRGIGTGSVGNGFATVVAEPQPRRDGVGFLPPPARCPVVMRSGVERPARK
jgi:hypothetical protein